MGILLKFSITTVVLGRLLQKFLRVFVLVPQITSPSKYTERVQAAVSKSSLPF